jgi:tetratricopeptide (TPR) repeat protein
MQSHAARDHHCEYFLKFVADRERNVKSAAQQEAMRELTREMDNIRVAWVWGIEHSKFELLAASVRCLGWMFEVGGLIREGIEQLEFLIQALKASPPDRHSERALGAALVQQGLLNFRTGQFLNAMQLYKEGIGILRSFDEPALLSDALIFSGTITHLNGDYLEAKKLIEEGLVCAHTAHDRWFSAYGIYNLGHVESLMGDYQKGYEQMNEGIRSWRELGDPHSISLGLNFLVETQIKLNRLGEATDAMHESILLCEQTKNRWGMGTAYRYLGLVTLAEGKFIEARAHFEKSLEIFGEYFKGWDIATTLIYLGEAKTRSGNQSEAKKHLLDALRLAHDIHSSPLMLEAVTSLSSLEKCLYPERVADWLALVISHPAATQDTRGRAYQILSETGRYAHKNRMQGSQEKSLDQSLEDLASAILNEP